MIKSKKELKKWINYERGKYGVSSNIFKYLIRYKLSIESEILFHFQKRLRTTEYLYNTKKRFRYRISNYKLRKIENKLTIHIPLNACDKGLKIMHLGPITMNMKTKLGTDCYIHVQTVFANNGMSEGAPTIGNHCIIGAGCIIIGEITIGDFTAIGANSLVNKSFEDGNYTIAGTPAKVVSKHSSKEWVHYQEKL